MELIEIVHVLLGLVVVSVFAVFMRLGSILIQLQINQQINNAYNDDHHKQRGELLQAQNETLDDLLTDIQQIKSDVEDMRYISDIFHKYKLPDKKEQEVLDRIAIDNEVFDGIAKARDKNT